MKVIYIFLLFLFLISLEMRCFAQETRNLVELNYSERGVIPAWVKNKTTPEEYKLWEIMSQYYAHIDYSILKSRKLSRIRKELYGNLRNECDRLRSGELKLPNNAGFGGVFLPPDTLVSLCSEDVNCIKKKCIVYSSIDGYDVHIELTILYEREENSDNIHIWNYSAKAISFSGMDITMYDSNLQLKLSYLPDMKMFKGYCGTNLTFKDPIGEEHFNPVSVNFFIKL